MPRLRLFALTMTWAASLAGPAFAAPALNTRLVNCRSESCLLISGNRPDPRSAVRVNGHAVSVEGRNKWRVRLPVSTVRAWSAPSARTMMVSVGDMLEKVDLPIGLLGHSNDLAMLVVRAR